MKEHRGLVISAIALITILLCAFLLINNIALKTRIGRLDVTLDSIKRAALTCYCVEGRYPMSVDYLRENYSLAYDDGEFVVFYNAFASNLMPDISVEFRED